jgi:hypothetical protein
MFDFEPARHLPLRHLIRMPPTLPFVDIGNSAPMLVKMR